MNYVFFAWMSVVFLGIVLVPFVMSRLNKYFLKTTNKNYFNVMKFFRSIHKPSGIILAIASYIHGSMVLGTIFRLHTGSIVFIVAIVTAILGILFYLRKKKTFLQVHRVFAGLTFLLFLLHFFSPWLL